MEQTLNDGWVGTWSPGIGDPTLMGWVTVAAYFGTAYLCLRAFKNRGSDKCTGWAAYVEATQTCFRMSRSFRRPLAEVSVLTRTAMVWLLLALLFVGLGVNKQLDLQTLVTETGRILAHTQGWYESRRKVQFFLVAAVFGVGSLGCLFLWRLAKNRMKELGLALIGTVLVVSYIVIRASSFHHVDLIQGFELFGIRMNWVFELGGIFLVALGAAPNAGFVFMERIRRFGSSAEE